MPAVQINVRAESAGRHSESPTACSETNRPSKSATFVCNRTSTSASLELLLGVSAERRFELREQMFTRRDEHHG